MSPDTSRSGVPRKRRVLTPAFYARARAFYQANGWTATSKKFRLSGAAMQKVAGTKPNGQGPLAPGITPPHRTGRQLYLAAKALERALMQHRKAGSPPSDIEHYAFFLLKEILK